MTNHIVLLTEENREDFLPCIMPQIHRKLTEPTVFGFGVLAGELDEPEEPAGAIVCEYDTGIVTLLSAGVLPRFQRQGLGSRLVEYLATSCARQRYLELVTSCWASEGITSPIESFFIDNGFDAIKGERVRYAVSIGDIAGSALERHITHKQPTKSSILTGLAYLSTSTLEQFIEDFDLLPDIFDEVDPVTSRVTVINDRITSAALLSIPQNGRVEVVYLCSREKEARATASVLFSALGKLHQTEPADTVVVFNPASDVVTRIAERLLEGCRTEQLHELLLYRSLLPMWGSEPTEPQEGAFESNAQDEQLGELL